MRPSHSNATSKDMNTTTDGGETAKVQLPTNRTFEPLNDILLRPRKNVLPNILLNLYDEIDTYSKEMAETKKNERANALKEVKRLCKEFEFTAGMLKGALAEGRKNRN